MRLNDYLYRSSMVVSAILAFAMLFALTDKKVSHDIKSFFKQQPREVIATVSGPFLGKNSKATAVKVRTADGIHIEIYDTSDNKYNLISKLNLGSRDAFFDFYGRSSNLAADDVTEDQTPEILVPLYDQNFVAQLAILKYDEERKEFIRL